MKQSYDQIKEETKNFLKYIKKHYPDQDIAEFTRLRDDLETFLKYGCWEEYNEDD